MPRRSNPKRSHDQTQGLVPHQDRVPAFRSVKGVPGLYHIPGLTRGHVAQLQKIVGRLTGENLPGLTVKGVFFRSGTVPPRDFWEALRAMFGGGMPLEDKVEVLLHHQSAGDFVLKAAPHPQGTMYEIVNPATGETVVDQQGRIFSRLGRKGKAVDEQLVKRVANLIRES